jgi:hypothetical protein
VLLVPVGRWPIRPRRDSEDRNREAVGGAASIFDHAHLDGAGEDHVSTLGSNDRRLGHKRLRFVRVDLHEP